LITHELRRTQLLPLPRKDVFPFFADAANLARITPPELKFRFVTELPIEMREDAHIQYKLSLFGVPFGWTTRIALWEPDEAFVDTQIRGPYKRWVHTHRFHDRGDHTEMVDIVEWALPLQPFGELVRPIVRRQLERIFDYRFEVIRGIFSGEEKRG
jgi:ligand-binding SRPBCC domain-containing protein